MSLWVPSENFNGGKDERPNPESIKGGENGRSKKNGIQPGEGSDVDACFHQCIFSLDAGYETFLAGDRTPLHLTNFDNRLNSSVPASFIN